MCTSPAAFSHTSFRLEAVKEKSFELAVTMHAGGTPIMPKKAKKSEKRDNGEKAKKEKGKQGEKANKGKKAKKVKGESPEKAQEPGFQENSGADDYWDEEDELEEYIMKKDLGQIKDDSDAGGSSAGSDSEGALSHLPCSVSKEYMMWKDLGRNKDDSNAGGSSAGSDCEGPPSGCACTALLPGAMATCLHKLGVFSTMGSFCRPLPHICIAPREASAMTSQGLCGRALL